MGYLNGALKYITNQLRLKGGVDAITMTGAVTLTGTSANILALDPGGASRTVTLPAAGDSDGLAFAIYNSADAAEDLTIAGPGTIVVIHRGELAIVGNDGGTWAKYGGNAEPISYIRTTVVGAATITAAALRGGILYQDASGGNVTMTTRTGTQCAADFSELAVGQGFMVRMASNHAVNTSTIAGGVDVTLVGSGAVTTPGGSLVLLKTTATTFDLIRVG